MITATAVKYPDGTVGLFTDPVRAELHAAQAHATVHDLVEKAAILRKFDGYEPADRVSALRWRIIELEERVQQLAGQVDASDRAASEMLELVTRLTPSPVLVDLRAGTITPACGLVDSPAITDRALFAADSESRNHD